MGLEIDKYMPLVKKMARQKMKTLPVYDQYDDLIQAGLLGLVQAFDRFEDNKGIGFLTFAYPRIHGAMVDCLRDAGLKKKWEPFRGVAVFCLDDQFDTKDKEGVAGLRAVDDSDGFEDLISELPLRQELVIRKIYEEGIAQLEIARQLNLSDTWISKLKTTALESIRRKIYEADSN